MNKLIGLIVAAWLGFVSVAQADYDEGVAAYEKGDYDTAYKELKPLAEQGDANAQISLGTMYYHGQGVPQDYKEAVEWYRKSAEQGNATAQYAFGVAYRKGQAVPQDDEEALNWFLKAAEQGLSIAQYALGELYRRGEGVPQDYILAHMWHNLSATQGSETAIKNRDVVAKYMTPDQIAEAEKLAREWTPSN